MGKVSGRAALAAALPTPPSDFLRAPSLASLGNRKGNVTARFSIPEVKGRLGGSGLLALTRLGRPVPPYVDGRVRAAEVRPTPWSALGQGESHASSAPVGVTRARSWGKITVFPLLCAKVEEGKALLITLVK